MTFRDLFLKGQMEIVNIFEEGGTKPKDTSAQGFIGLDSRWNMTGNSVLLLRISSNLALPTSLKDWPSRAYCDQITFEKP
ncbi:Hypothetical protein NTJ_05326 [Nesidiocoris tenuis]|uniref:Uncharacterized protein n=1 Tax=Nesidiocoris tenuis TaxID=355587 RepID=A0ABN7AJU1_9HEMI|nr:Hypothetical protein NTJ_05326 [Nesidiocoris tenuis]